MVDRRQTGRSRYISASHFCIEEVRTILEYSIIAVVMVLIGLGVGYFLRKNIAEVSQDVFLFNGTIEENIRYGAPEATAEQVEAAARAANAHDFIMSFPKKYKSKVGEGGALLSGGQKQRIAIARAILKDAPILLLDEATSALDTQSEKLIQAALKDLMKGRTTFVIAHRLSTILDADIICVIKDGQIIEQGTDAELIALDGEYKKLRDIQFKKKKDK